MTQPANSGPDTDNVGTAMLFGVLVGLVIGVWDLAARGHYKQAGLLLLSVVIVYLLFTALALFHAR